VAGGVDDQQAGQLEVEGAALAQHLGARQQRVARDVGGPDLLGDAARLAVLHVGAPDVVQDLGLAGVHVAQDAADGGTQVRGVARGQRLAEPLVARLARGCGRGGGRREA
jgi:hypothetical protein